MSDYKKSNNTIPKHWRWATLGELAIVGPNNGVFKRRQDFGSGVRLVNVADLYKSLKVNISNLERVQITDSEMKKYEVLKGDLFFCRSSLKREGIGWCCYAGEITEPTVYECHVMRIRPNPKIADSKFIAYYWQHPDVRNEIITKAKTATMTTMNQQDLSEVIIPLPPLPEQKRIAEVLDKADALREKRRLALQKLDTLLQSVFLEMFGDPMKNPKGWEKNQLKEIGKVTTGATPSSELSNMFGGEVPFVTPSDLERVDKQVSRTLTDEGGKQSRIVRKGSTLVCCIGATIGKVGKAFVPSAFNQQINAIEWNEDINDDFGFHLLKFYKPIIAALGASTTLPILKKSSFEKIKFPVPPIDLQNDFSEIVKKIESLKSKEMDSLKKAENLFQSLQQRAFKGELFSNESLTVKPQEGKVWQQTSPS